MLSLCTCRCLFSCCILKLGVTVCLLQVSPLTINVTPSSNRHPIGDETTTRSPPLSSEDEETHAALIGSRKFAGNFRKRPQPLASDSNADDEQETTQQSSSSQSSELKPKRPKVIKTEDDATPLPYPFPLPKYYRSDVEIALKNGKITKETTSSFSCCFSYVGVQAVPNKRGLHLEQLM